MTLTSRSLLAALSVSVIAVAPATAEVPTVADFAGCNMKAAEQVAADSASASPRTDLPRDATKLPSDVKPAPPRVSSPAPAGRPDTATVRKDPTGSTLSSDKDPQVEGMAADRANDPVYVAAYRSCMRQRGF